MILRLAFTCLLLLLAGCQSAQPRAVVSTPELISVNKIWDAAPHNAFTDLIAYRGELLCVFREGEKHVSPGGAIRVIASTNGLNWASAALLKSPDGDLRDPKITFTPKGLLMLTAAVALRQPAAHHYQSLAWFSSDGRNWGEPFPIGEPDFWLWRATWYRDKVYSVGYETGGENIVRLYSGHDGANFRPLVPSLFSEGKPNETGMAFLPDGTCVCLLRRDGAGANGLLGTARPPYTKWDWKDTGQRIGGPNLIQLPDRRLVAAVRTYEGGAATTLAWVDPKTGQLSEFLRLPSGGDNSYAGMVWLDGVLLVSYYSSHEGRTSIYLAQVKL